MKKTVNRKINKDLKAKKFFNRSLGLLIVALTLSIFSSLFIKNINNSLTMQIEDIKKETESLKTQNDQLSIEISNLASKDRVYEIATAAGLSQSGTDANNVVRGE